MNLYYFIFIFFTINLFAQDSSKYYFEHHNIKLPLNNKGVLADVKVGENKTQMRFNDSVVVYSCGFLLSGFADGRVWANGMATAANVADYLPGSYKNSHYNNSVKLYTLKSSDTPFGESWQEWKNAVKLGADFYDGNNDGLYNPIDINDNGKWDLDEDRPDLLGEQTAWCVYKDDLPSISRTYRNAKPMGIEIQQSVFASSINESFENTIFVRYRIENVGLVTDLLDSVYFGAWLDPDLGYFLDDLVGCDTTINAGYTYQNSSDNESDESVPTVLVSILQGPPTYIADSTFIDVNDNGFFDETDTPITQAYANNGFAKGISYTEGAINSEMTSVIYFLQSSMIGGHELESEQGVRSCLLGIPYGEIINACNWDFGEILNEDCKNLNGLFAYSGDPVLLKGWINTQRTDQRMMINTGPFNLWEDHPIDIVVAYTIGYDYTHSLRSLSDAKIKARNVKFYFLNNAFETIDKPETPICIEPIMEFVLEQNYPNPFNPTTKISYSIPLSDAPQNVTLKVYNLLGEVALTLVDETQTIGSYSVNLSSENLSSGVYIYSLQNGNNYQSKKLMVLK